MRPYAFDYKNRRGYIIGGYPTARPNRTAAGMTYTANRGSKPHFARMDYERATLSVRGTLDKLAMGYWRITERAPCPCCGAKSNGKLRLNGIGRVRLARLRHRVEQRKRGT